jgi:cytochrome c-type biogenesis protein CcmE
MYASRHWSAYNQWLYNEPMKAGMKFTLGAVLIVGAVGYLMATGVKQTGQYFLTPSELSQKLAADPTFYDVGMRVGARVVPGSVTRDVAHQTLAFRVTDGSASYPVVYRGIAPDTFTDSVEVVVEGRIQHDGVIHATDVLAKCGSRYESVPKA